MTEREKGNTMPETTEDMQVAQPDEQVKALERLIGSWRVSGGAEGTVTFRRLEEDSS